MMKSHEIPVRVYYEDTDAGGIVFYANYLKFCERGRTEFLRSAGFENKPLREREGFMFVVRHLEADYLAPAYLDDLLILSTAVELVKNASFVMKQSVFRHDLRLFEMNVTLVCVGRDNRPVRLPEKLKEALLP